MRRTIGTASALVAASALGLGAACGDGDDVGHYCCNCRCCNVDVHLTRDDQSWPDCDEPCRRTCEQELGCHEMVESAVSCDP